MKYSSNKHEVKKHIMELVLNSAALMFVEDLVEAVSDNKKMNVLPYDSRRRPFTDVLKDFDMEESSIELIFEKEDPFRFIFSANEIQAPSRDKYYVNSKKDKQELTICFINDGEHG